MVSSLSPFTKKLQQNKTKVQETKPRNVDNMLNLHMSRDKIKSERWLHFCRLVSMLSLGN